MEKQSAYIYRDSYINAYLIHPLFLEFLTGKQHLLSEEHKNETYKTAALWCNKNGFKTDALSYYEKAGDYAALVSILYKLSDIVPAQIPQDIAKYAAAIFERAPAHIFDTVEGLAILHFSSVICQGLWRQSEELAKYYEKKYLKLPKDDPFRQRTLGILYYLWAFLRGLMSAIDDDYDFDVYVEKFCECIPKPFNVGMFSNHNPGPWIICAGSAHKGALEKYLGALSRTVGHMSRYFGGSWNGVYELARGEILFFQGDIGAAEPLITNALARSREVKQDEMTYWALFYSLRIAVVQGDYPKAECIIRDLKAQLYHSEYTNRYFTYDTALAWYYYILGLPEKVPEWLHENFSPYFHTGSTENFANQIKARFCYMTRAYPLLLSYIEGMKMRESFLFGRVEMLAIEACVHYKMKDRQKAFAALLEAYKTAEPNNLVMPFIELGKDMRTLTGAALKESGSSIPSPWLENLNRKSASYAKQQSHVTAEYRRINGIIGTAPLSTRETEILTDLSHGLSRTEIAASRDLSVNTVKMVINNIYNKLGTENLATLIRIAVERKLI
jgi:LuxR family maltose regulon positive regulatory protein